MDETLEELYTLLDLYFRIETPSGIVRTKEHVLIEPALDRAIFRKEIFEKIIAKSQELLSL